MEKNIHLFAILVTVVLLVTTSCQERTTRKQSRVTPTAKQMPFTDPKLPIDEGVSDLIGRMILEEKVS